MCTCMCMHYVTHQPPYTHTHTHRYNKLSQCLRVVHGRERTGDKPLVLYCFSKDKKMQDTVLNNTTRCVCVCVCVCVCICASACIYGCV
jgi:hypothetical protein